MDICRATKANGEPCKLPATGQHGLCWAHAPENAEKRRRVASRGGRGKAAKKVAILWDEVRGVIEGVEAKRLTPGQGNTMLRGYNTLIELAKLEIDQGELEIQQRRLDLDIEQRTELRDSLEELEDAERRRKEMGKMGIYGA
jgi:hypothetical protein